MLSIWVKVMLEMDDKIRHLHCDTKSVIIEEVYGKGLRKHLAGLVGVGQGV